MSQPYRSKRATGLLSLGLAFAVLAALPGCSKKVTRIDPNSTVDLSGNWNDADSRLVAEEMVSDALNRPWIMSYQAAKKTPRIIVGNIRNKSHEHISVETFVKDIERALINSGKAEFVASKEERKQLRDEKADQVGNASEETRQISGEESGADLMLIGSINTIVDQEGSKSVLFYQTNLELVEIESHKKVWLGDKKIKKYVTRSKAKL